MCAVEFRLGDNAFKLLNVYRPPKASNLKEFFDIFNTVLSKLCQNRNVEVIICGDFNIDQLEESVEKLTLLTILGTYGINIQTEGPTRITTSTRSGLDSVYTSFKDNVSCTIDHNGLSDHSAWDIDINIPKAKIDKGSKSNLTRMFTAANFERFDNMLLEEDWSKLDNISDTEASFTNFTNTLKDYIDAAFPLRKRFASNKKPWITSGIYKSSQTSKQLYKKAVSTQLQTDFDHYKQYKKIYRAVIRKAKYLHNNSRYWGARNKSKAAWQIINNNFCNGSKHTISEIIEDNNTYNNPIVIANKFNNYFVNITEKYVSKFNNSNFNAGCVRTISNSLYLDPVTPREVLNTILGLKSSNSVGVDGISANILRHAAENLVPPLTCLINRSFADGIFPNNLKTARVLPLFKSGSCKQMSNYRPVSLLSAISKVLEKIMCDRLLSFLTRYNILNPAQHGFIKNKSTKTALLDYLNALYENLNNNKKCVGAFMDLSKAFDMVDHPILLSKLSSYGIRGKTLSWIESYLKDRLQTVDIEGKLSNALPVMRGVPQGSVIGPLLFIIFINDLPNVSSGNSVVLYADDSSFISSNNNKELAIKETETLFNKFSTWFQSNKLYLNIQKTSFLAFTPGFGGMTESNLIRINGVSVPQTSNIKFLGLHLDNSLNWETHITNLSSKLASVCFGLYRLKDIVSREILLSYYYAYFQSKISYAILFWGASSFSKVILLQQKTAVRNIVGVRRRVSCRPYFKHLKILTLASLYIFEIAMYVRRNKAHFKINKHYHDYHTRYGNHLATPMHRLVTFERSPQFMGVKIYNAIPNNLKQITCDKIFGLKLKEYLTDKCFYTVGELLDPVEKSI